MDDPIIDLQSDHCTSMGEALRQAARFQTEEVPVGAVVVREGRIIARASNQVELLKTPPRTPRCSPSRRPRSRRRLAAERLHALRRKEPCPMCARHRA